MNRRRNDQWDEEDVESSWEEGASGSEGDLGDDDTMACPKCGESMYEDSPRCPSCGEYVTHEAGSTVRSSMWMMIGMGLALLVAFGWLLIPML
jgi:uncharacterized paraquat-inducible protein A